MGGASPPDSLALTVPNVSAIRHQSQTRSREACRKVSRPRGSGQQRATSRSPNVAVAATALKLVAAWIGAIGLAHFDKTCVGLRVVTRSTQETFDERRPSLCLAALSSLVADEIPLENTSTETEQQIRGPFAGGATSWKSGFAYEAFKARLRPTATAAAAPWSFSDMAQRLEVDVANITTLLTDPDYAMPRPDIVPVNHEHDMQVLRSVQISWGSVPSDSLRARSLPRLPRAESAMEPMPFVNRPLPTKAPERHVRVQTRNRSVVPLRFRDMLKDPRRAQHLQEYLVKLREALRGGRRLHKPFILRDVDLKEQFQGTPWDLSDWDNVVPLDDSDVDMSRSDAFPSGRDVDAIEQLLPEYVDCRMLWSLRFGVPSLLDDDMPIAIVLSPPNASALPHLKRLAEMDDGGLEEGWASSHASVPSFPFSAHPYGMDVKFTDSKIKYRETSDYSGPHLPGGDDSLAVNSHAHPDDVNLPSIRTLMRAAAVIRSASHRCRDGGHFTRPTEVVVDAVAMYKQFETRVKDRMWQGKVALDTERNLRIMRSEVSDFGGCWLPSSASGISGAVDRCSRLLFWEWDDRMCTLAADEPASLAAKLCPHSYRVWKSERQSLLQGVAELRSPHYNEAYLDDELAFMLGPLRALMFLLIYCRVLRLFGMEPSLGKLKLGDGHTMLGVDFYVHDGVCIPSEQKLQLYEAWTSRLIGLVQNGSSVITKKELESFNGSLNFGAFAIPDARIHLQYFFKLAAARLSPTLRRKGICPLPSSLVSHAEAIRGLFRATSGLAFVEDALEASSSVAPLIGITDANHCFSNYCGMGGVLVSLGVWWFFEFKDHAVLRHLKVHVLEMMADVINVAIAAALAPGVRYCGRIDNQSAMFGIRAQNASDLKLFELLLTRHAICRRSGLRAEVSEYVTSEANPTDPISRGKFDEFLARAEKELGVREMTCIDLVRSPLGADVHTLIKHLCLLADLLTE